MRIVWMLILIAAAIAAPACDGWTTGEKLLAPDEALRQGSGNGHPALHVTADVRSLHTWSFIEWSRWQMDVRVEPDGTLQGMGRVMFGYDPTCVWCPPSEVWFEQEPVCATVDRSSREAWLSFYMWSEDLETDHWFIVQVRDLAPDAKPAHARNQSGRTDLITFRSHMSTEPPDFCLGQPDLSEIEVAEYGLPPVELLPIESGDIRILGGR